MINIATLRARRVQADFQELTIADAITLCRMPPAMAEAAHTALLRRVVVPNDKPLPGQVTDVRLWTVQERLFAVSHYIAHVAEDGPNFAIGNGNYSDYIHDGESGPPTKIDLGVVGGDLWSMVPLLGWHAEAIERLIQHERLPAERHGWWVGAMACQLLREQDEPLSHELMDVEVDDQIAKRAAIFLQFPETDFLALLMAFLAGQDQMAHLFRIEFLDDGIAVMPKPVDDKEAPGLPPARFPVSDAITTATKRLFGKPD